MLFEDFFNQSRHLYTVATIGFGKKEVNKSFSSRESATRFMYKLCDKNSLHIVEVWDDGHYKTYRCANGVNFYINRL